MTDVDARRRQRPPQRVDARIAERRREVRHERRRRRLRRTLALAVLLVLLGVGYAVERSPLVALAEIEVRGTEVLDRATVLDAADLALGTSTLRLGLGDVEARVRALPLVRDVEARRLDPLTVRITIEERRPYVAAASGRAGVVLDADGIVTTRGRAPGLPVIALPAEVGLPAPGEDVASRPALDAAFTVFRALPAVVARRVVRVDAHSVDEIDLRLGVPDGDPLLVHVGRAERLDEKIRALTAVLADVREAPVSSIDVRAPANPVVRS